jgi:hypothetical protein
VRKIVRAAMVAPRAHTKIALHTYAQLYTMTRAIGAVACSRCWEQPAVDTCLWRSGIERNSRPILDLNGKLIMLDAQTSATSCNASRKCLQAHSSRVRVC